VNVLVVLFEVNGTRYMARDVTVCDRITCVCFSIFHVYSKVCKLFHVPCFYTVHIYYEDVGKEAFYTNVQHAITFRVLL